MLDEERVAVTPFCKPPELGGGGTHCVGIGMFPLLLLYHCEYVPHVAMVMYQWGV